ncbi:MAG: NUDIX hydrolase [Desulforhopalus sp.]
MNYCSHCAAPVVLEIPPDDNLARFVCTSCSRVHYQNPKVVVGCIPIWDERILLCKRNIEPRKGSWTLPAGYLECSETTEEGARRETFEETGTLVEGLQLYRLFDISHIDQVYLMFLARIQALDFHPTEESIDVRLFKEKNIPWGNISFPVIEKTLHHYFNDRRENSFTFRQDQVTQTMKTSS